MRCTPAIGALRHLLLTCAAGLAASVPGVADARGGGGVAVRGGGYVVRNFVGVPPAAIAGSTFGPATNFGFLRGDVAGFGGYGFTPGYRFAPNFGGLGFTPGGSFATGFGGYGFTPDPPFATGFGGHGFAPGGFFAAETSGYGFTPRRTFLPGFNGYGASPRQSFASGFGTTGIAPFAAASTPPRRVGAVQVWYRQGEVWQVAPTIATSATWHRDAAGLWHPFAPG